jgi:hypothetical protein
MDPQIIEYQTRKKKVLADGTVKYYVVTNKYKRKNGREDVLNDIPLEVKQNIKELNDLKVPKTEISKKHNISVYIINRILAN